MSLGSIFRTTTIDVGRGKRVELGPIRLIRLLESINMIHLYGKKSLRKNNSSRPAWVASTIFLFRKFCTGILPFCVLAMASLLPPTTSTSLKPNDSLCSSGIV
ncbi:hypothetical protein BDV36DRAFT_6836 [Aspergillus pseudocaelatus]|uniref:Uncharacterized protein n=1 Tax=Aspergillus pseudocaelatus TaxID=1825620 RepID=A0ABQ6WYL3_9EURO|nr:hypothetical protein BDV36DRAFT_6836 [Aspergillus pseudocaelatus]